MNKFIARFDILSIIIFNLFCILFCTNKASAQTSPNFDFSLGIDYSSAEQTLDFFERRTSNSKQVAKLRGNQLAALTSVMLARTEKSDDDFSDQLELARNLSTFESDVYGFSTGRSRIQELRKLLQEMRKRHIDRRIVATIAAYFPEQVKISTQFSTYLVVLGNERAAAYVRNVVWNYDVPTFVSEDKGEPVIVVNLARVIERSHDLESQFIEVLSITAHECFHAALSILQKSLSESIKPRNAAEQLLNLVQNEGLAYYLSMQTHIGGEVPSPNWFNITAKAIETLNRALLELHSSNLTYSRARELIMDANLSGSFEENYGSTSGLRMAYEIDNHLGRSALSETLLGGGRRFLSAYQKACSQDGSLPRIDKQVVRLMKLE
jgi:hypothetical protein